ncbi:MAG: excinuclease ABC subunit UvrB [Candidatus Hydrothermales bacterium]
MAKFELVTDLVPKGDQPKAIKELVEGLKSGLRHQVLLGVTGSGKTFTIANVIKEWGKPTLIISHNKTLAAQLYGELKQLFPHNAVEYFISYYDYYQPEAYIPETDTYIEKDASINEDIERLRLRTTSSLLERDDVIVVASVSCIYGLGNPEEVKKLYLILERGQNIERDVILRRLVDLYYTRNDFELASGRFRVKGDVIELIPAYENYVVRIELFDDFIEKIEIKDKVTGATLEKKNKIAIYPASHYVTTRPTLENAIISIEKELEERLRELREQGKLLEAQRLEQRTRFDIEMLKEIGYCPGIENYSRHFDGRKPGERPKCLIDYFPPEFLCIIDESHVTIPQLKAMYRGDRSRKEVLVEYGFRLPSALDNRPLKFEEFEALVDRVIYMSATPSDYEIEKAKGRVVEMIVRPTGLVDPEIVVKPTRGQVDDLMEEIRKVVEKKERVLVTTLTKRMAEDLAEYLSLAGFRVKYLHSEIEPIERIEILRDLRLGKFDCLVGVNLLREGLDLPEVSLVAILDADKAGFLRSETALIQTAGRAARNRAGKVILYADEMTEAMKRAILETERRRKIQMEYNEKHGIIPETIKKTKEQILMTTIVADARIELKEEYEDVEKEIEILRATFDRITLLEELERRMREAADLFEFEKAAKYRDALFELRKKGSL